MFAAYVLCGAQDMDAVRLTLEQIDVIRRICTEYPDFELVTSTQGMVLIVLLPSPVTVHWLLLFQINKRTGATVAFLNHENMSVFAEVRDSMTRRKIACLISIEGGHSIDSSLPALRMFYQLGVRSMSLTHSCNTPWYSIKHAVSKHHISYL